MIFGKKIKHFLKSDLKYQKSVEVSVEVLKFCKQKAPGAVAPRGEKGGKYEHAQLVRGCFGRAMVCPGPLALELGGDLVEPQQRHDAKGRVYADAKVNIHGPRASFRSFSKSPRRSARGFLLVGREKYG